LRNADNIILLAIAEGFAGNSEQARKGWSDMRSDDQHQQTESYVKE
jgi:hypothetical protein